MVKFEPALAFDGQVDVSYVVRPRYEADDPGDEEDQALKALEVGYAV